MIIIHVTKKNPEQPKISSRVTARRTSVISVKFCDQEFFYFADDILQRHIKTNCGGKSKRNPMIP